MTSEPRVPPEIALRMHDPRVMDSRARMIDSAQMPPEAVEGAVEVMNAMFRWREAERRVTEASRRFMQLGETDMKALRYAIMASDQGRHVTARDLADHLAISSASVTKLLDRLEHGDHIRRTPHPSDRRAIAVVVNEETRRAAEETIGREQVRRFRIAAALTPEERATVIRFLNALSETSEGGWSER